MHNIGIPFLWFNLENLTKYISELIAPLSNGLDCDVSRRLVINASYEYITVCPQKFWWHFGIRAAPNIEWNSRCHRILWPAIRRLQLFRYLHDCSGCFRLEHFAGWDLHPLEKRRLCTAHTLKGHKRFGKQTISVQAQGPEAGLPAEQNLPALLFMVAKDIKFITLYAYLQWWDASHGRFIVLPKKCKVPIKIAAIYL